MGNRRISNDVKDLATSLYTKGWQIDDIAILLSVSVSSIYRWLQNLNDVGTVIQPQTAIGGRVRVVTRAALTVMRRLYQEDSDMYLDEVLIWLSFHYNMHISLAALQRTLSDAGLTYNVLQKIAAERNEDLREELRDVLADPAMFSGDGSEFVVLHETSRDERTSARRHDKPISSARALLQDVFSQGDRYWVLGALTTDGYLAFRVVEGSFDAEEFHDFVQEEVLIHMTPYPGERSVLILDNCNTHHHNVLAQLFRAAGCLLVNLPAYSPDLTPIDELYSCLKEDLRRPGSTLRREDGPIEAFIEATACVTAEKARGWFKNAGYIREE